MRVKIALWLWARLTKWIVAHKPEVLKPQREEVAVQLPEYLYMDGTLMPDRCRAIKQ